MPVINKNLPSYLVEVILNPIPKKNQKQKGSTVLIMLNYQSERGNREQGTGNRVKRQFV
jgi:hypothetical protein